MKNKHLVLIFFGVLILGFMARNLPFHYRSFFKKELIRIDTSQLEQCSILLPGQPELILNRMENGWVAQQLNRSTGLSDGQVIPFLTVLGDLHVLRTIKSERPDTLGLSDSDRLCITLRLGNARREQFWLGKELVENGTPATCLQMPQHEGMYLVPGYLRRLFRKSLNDFRSNSILPATLDSLRRFGFQWPEGLPIFFEKSDSAGDWRSSNGQYARTADTVREWTHLFEPLKTAAFADNFDESQANESLIATVYLEFQEDQLLALRFFYVRPPDIPEDLTDLRTSGARKLYSHILNSSLNPVNYFAIEDTSLARRICFGLASPK